MLSFLVIFFVVPETKQRTLEELDVVFSISTVRHASYQSKVWLPYWVRRNVIMQRMVTLERELIE